MDNSWSIFAWIYNQWASSYVLYYQFNANSSQKSKALVYWSFNFLNLRCRKETTLDVCLLVICSHAHWLTLLQKTTQWVSYTGLGVQITKLQKSTSSFSATGIWYDHWFLQKTTQWVSSTGLYSPASSPSAWWHHILQVISPWCRFPNPLSKKTANNFHKSLLVPHISLKSISPFRCREDNRPLPSTVNDIQV